jgi:hypothetical protein
VAIVLSALASPAVSAGSTSFSSISGKFSLRPVEEAHGPESGNAFPHRISTPSERSARFSPLNCLNKIAGGADGERLIAKSSMRTKHRLDI